MKDKKNILNYYRHFEIYNIELEHIDKLTLDVLKIKTTRQLCELTERELYKIINQNIKEKDVVELKVSNIKKALAKVGLSFKEDKACINKQYIELFYGECDHRVSGEKEASETDEKFVIDDKDAIAFRYFEKAEAIIDGKLLRGEAKNYSDIHFIGTKMTAEECIIKYKNDNRVYLRELEGSHKDDIVIVCDTGKIIVDLALDHMTTTELLSNKDLEKTKIYK